MRKWSVIYRGEMKYEMLTGIEGYSTASMITPGYFPCTIQTPVCIFVIVLNFAENRWWYVGIWNCLDLT